MTLNDLLEAIETGETTVTHSEWLSEFIHNLNNRIQGADMDLSMSKHILGVAQNQPLAPAIKRLFSGLDQITP